jgi:di/tricarboxylate transporter
MLACLLPIGDAFDRVGGTALVAGSIADLSAGSASVIALVAIMVVAMMLSDVLNNVATMVITGPIAIDLAQRLGANPDTFLMGTAIAASCAFLTPIGHKNNTLIMGPGGLRFADYWRMGLPLEVVVLVVAVPMLLLVWPI